MIVRVVKMTFSSDRVEDFLKNFHEHKEQIRGFEGCEHLELLQQEDDPEVFFTYSHWQSTAHLEKYRHSELFKGVWAFTKSLFSAKPEAWSLTSQEKL